MSAREEAEGQSAASGRIDRRQVDQDRTFDAMQRLESALGTAAPGREAAWRDEVRGALELLRDATIDEARNAAEADSLLSDIARTQFRLRNRVRGLRVQYRQLQEAITSLSEEIDGLRDEQVDFADLRQRIAWVLTALRHQRARESDLIYEAYYEAFASDLPRDADVEQRGETSIST